MRTGAVFLLFSTLFLSAMTQAAERGFSNYDGDTFKATFRIANVDTPEIKGKCPSETELAKKAQAFTKDFLAQNNLVITQTGVDRYGRILVTVQHNGVDLGEVLVAAGLAREWTGKRESWC